jgi:hypothetical protein
MVMGSLLRISGSPPLQFIQVQPSIAIKQE